MDMTDAAVRTTVGMVTALFRDREAAERAYRCVAGLGYRGDDINVLMSDDTRQRYFSSASAPSPLSEQAEKSADGPTPAANELGGPAGGTLGTIAPVVAALGTLLLIPGLGLVAAGPIAVALTAAGAVGVAGGLIAALTDWGIPHGRVQEYEGGIREGGILLGVKPRSADDTLELVRCWQTNGGEYVHS
jgi:hypothetical protein